MRVEQTGHLNFENVRLEARGRISPPRISHSACSLRAHRAKLPVGGPNGFERGCAARCSSGLPPELFPSAICFRRACCLPARGDSFAPSLYGFEQGQHAARPRYAGAALQLTAEPDHLTDSAGISAHRRPAGATGGGLPTGPRHRLSKARHRPTGLRSRPSQPPAIHSAEKCARHSCHPEGNPADSRAILFHHSVHAGTSPGSEYPAR